MQGLAPACLAISCHITHSLAVLQHAVFFSVPGHGKPFLGLGLCTHTPCARSAFPWQLPDWPILTLQVSGQKSVLQRTASTIFSRILFQAQPISAVRLFLQTLNFNLNSNYLLYFILCHIVFNKGKSTIFFSIAPFRAKDSVWNRRTFNKHLSVELTSEILYN